MRVLLTLAALCAGVSATSQDSEVREVARVAADAIASPRARVKEYNNNERDVVWVRGVYCIHAWGRSSEERPPR